VKDSGRPAPGRFVSSSDSGDVACALVKPTIMARKMMRASRGADPRRTAELRRAASLRAREVTTQTRGCQWRGRSSRLMAAAAEASILASQFRRCCRLQETMGGLPGSARGCARSPSSVFLGRESEFFALYRVEAMRFGAAKGEVAQFGPKFESLSTRFLTKLRHT
jgi:hypothetical protein